MRYATCLLIVALALGCGGGDETPTSSTTSRGPAPFPEGADVVAWLEADFQALLADDPNAEAIGEIAERLADEAPLDHLERREIVASLRRYRSRATVPMLIKHYLQGRQRDSRYHEWELSEQCLVLLTGADISVLGIGNIGPREQKPHRDRVEALVREWYIPNYHTITTDVDAMTPPQLWRFTRELIAVQPYRTRYAGLPGLYDELRRPDYAKAFVNFAIRPPDRLAQSIFPGEVSGEMVPYLLAAARMERGRSQRISDPLPNDREGIVKILAEARQVTWLGNGLPPQYRQFTARLDYSVVPILAELRKAGLAPQLDAIIANPAAAPAHRLICPLVLARAGEPMPAEPLLSLVDYPEDLLFRLPAIAALRHVQPSQAVTDKLRTLLDDSEPRVRAAAMAALKGDSSPELVAAVGEILSQSHDDDPMAVRAYEAMLRIRPDASADAVAELLAATLANPDKERPLRGALWVMERLTGRRFSGPGAVDRARQALAWWHSNRDT